MSKLTKTSPIAGLGSPIVSANRAIPHKIRFLAVGMSADQLAAYVGCRDNDGICNPAKPADVEILAFANERARRTTRQQLQRDDIPTADVDASDLRFLVHDANEIESEVRSRDEIIDLRRQVIETFKAINDSKLNQTMNRLRYAGSAMAVCSLLTLRDRLTTDDIDKAIETDVELSFMPWSVHENFDWIEIAALHCDGHAILYRDGWESASLEELWLNDCDAASIQHLTDDQRESLANWKKQIAAAHANFMKAVA